MTKQLKTKQHVEIDQPDISLEWRLTYSRAARNEPDTRETIYEDTGVVTDENGNIITDGNGKPNPVIYISRYYP